MLYVCVTINIVMFLYKESITHTNFQVFCKHFLIAFYSIKIIEIIYSHNSHNNNK